MIKKCKSQYHVGNCNVNATLFGVASQKNICKVCLSKMRKKERKKNKLRIQQEQKNWRKLNQLHIKQYGHNYRNTSHGQQIRQQSYERNRNQKRQYDKNRRQEVPGVREKYNAVSAKYRAVKLQATPKWFEKKQIEQIYLQCKQITETTGIKHHVDHIIPLQGKLVCGLHCLANLGIIPGKKNISKRNKFNIN